MLRPISLRELYWRSADYETWRTEFSPPLRRACRRTLLLITLAAVALWLLTDPVTPAWGGATAEAVRAVGGAALGAWAAMAVVVGARTAWFRRGTLRWHRAALTVALAGAALALGLTMVVVVVVGLGRGTHMISRALRQSLR